MVALGPVRGPVRGGAAGTVERATRVGTEDLGWPRGPEEEPLPDLASQRPQLLELLARLDALGDRRESKRARESDHRAHDRGAVLAHADAFGERAIDLQCLDRQPLEVGQ